jgi:hypothetical protein
MQNKNITVESKEKAGLSLSLKQQLIKQIIKQFPTLNAQIENPKSNKTMRIKLSRNI